MQVGVSTVGDVTADPTTGRTPTEAERIRALRTIAVHAGQAGLDVSATGEHHEPPSVPSAVTTLLAWVAARTTALQLPTSVAHITTNDPVRTATPRCTATAPRWRTSRRRRR